MSKADLNLFVIFDAIMQEQSITAAAKRLFMTQPSVSNAVARMRYSWNDELFVKQGRGIKATPFANQLWQQISEPLNTISHAVNPVQFIPAIARRKFRISLTDGMTSVLWLPLRKILEQQAPGIDIHAVPFRGDGEQLLLSNEVDLVLDGYQGSNKLIHSQWMSDFKFVGVMRPDHALAKQPLSLEKFLAAEHLFVSLSGDAQGAVDTHLTELGKQRRIAMTVNSFSGAFPLLTETNLICTLPDAATADAVAAGLVITKTLPIKLGDIKIYMAWHTRQHRDPALNWLKNIIDQVYTKTIIDRVN
ncbi:MAG: LysR family transcriptional regulator [Oceanospirillaceae bacterium]|nr:LysR family transcriptional regulator [Oceanospirillaceae bacterium]